MFPISFSVSFINFTKSLLSISHFASFFVCALVFALILPLYTLIIPNHALIVENNLDSILAQNNAFF